MVIYMNKKTVKDIDLKGKRILARCDFNVPQDDKGAITDDTRIREALPTIKYLIENKAKVVLCSHFGRPKDGVDPKYSLKPVAVRLSELLGQSVTLAADVVGADAKAKANALKEGEVLLLENVRFEKGETKNNPELSKEFASLAEIFVQDAFGTSHRAHSSTAGVVEFLPTAVAGFLIQKEIEIMGGALANPKRPFVAILGGAKVSDKIGVINNLLEKVNTIVIGGAMAYTFLAAKGGKLGNSRVELDKVDLAKELMAKAEEKGVKILLPVDTVITNEFSPTADARTVPSMEVPDGFEGLDIGEKTREIFANEIRGAKTVIMNGPMGVFEFDKFAQGTLAIAKAIVESGAISIIGGGDSASAIEKTGLKDKVTHISTGGGASLEFLEGKELPGIAVLNDK